MKSGDITYSFENEETLICSKTSYLTEPKIILCYLNNINTSNRKFLSEILK